MKKTFTYRLLLLLASTLVMTHTQAQVTYCSPTFGYSCQTGYYISNVSVGGVSNTVSGCANHNYTATAGDTISLTAGTAANMSVTVQGYDMPLGVWIDLNGNGNFNDTAENLYIAQYTFNNPNTFSFNVTVPLGVPTGYYRMRVISPWLTTMTASMGCGTFTYWGAYQDYTVHVSGTTCNPYLLHQPQANTVCAAQSDTFSVLAWGSYLQYQWKYNNNDIPGATNASYILNNIVPANAGNYTCYVIDSGCGSGGTTSNIAILTVNPLPVISAAGPMSFCPGGSVTLTSSASNNNQWTLNGINIYQATGNSLTVTQPGVYNVVYFNNCPSLSLPDTVSFLPAPNPVISPSGTNGVVKVCIGNNQVFNSTTGNTWSYQWKRNGTSINGANSSSVIATQSGTYTITSTNSYGCTTLSSPVQLQVNTPPTSSITTIGSKILCAGGYKTLYANSSDPAATFQWQLNGSNIAGATSQTYATYSAGTFNLISNNGCSVVSAPINITNLLFPSISASGPTTFCAGANVKLSSSVTDTAGIQYQWIKDGNNITNANSTIYYANDSGTYQILIVVDSSCSAMSSPQTINVYPAPTPLIVANGGGIVLNTTQVYPHYQWYAGNTPTTLNPISGETNYSYTVSQNGYYAVAVNDFNNCSGMSSAIYVTMPTNGIQNMAQVAAMVSLYPNPAHHTIYIKAPIKVNASVAGIDGRVLIQANEATELDISELAAGMYMIRISDVNGNMIKTEKIIKD